MTQGICAKRPQILTLDILISDISKGAYIRPRDSLKGLGQRTSLYHFKFLAHYRTTQSVV